MSVCLTQLMDCEKYLLAEMVYYHIPPELARRDFTAEPMPLSELIDLIAWSESGGLNPKGTDGTTAAFVRRAKMRLRRIYDTHPLLHDLRLTSYVNDNHGAYATTDGVKRSSFVAMAYRDEKNNGLVVCSGCEMHAFRPMMADYLGCFAAALGVVTDQHRAALRFYDAAMAGVTGERGLIGHSKGGNLATYIFVNRLDQPLRAYCINAQPYCWWRLNDKQRAALKSERYEFIVHEGDVVYRTGYASYVSRIVQVNPFLNRRQIASFHGFLNMRYDYAGNLEGKRVLRVTSDSLKQRVFGDKLSEKPPTREEVVARFQTLMTLDMSPSRLLSVALEEMCIATQVDTVALMRRVINDPEDFLYVCHAKGEGAGMLRDMRLRIEKGDKIIQTIASGLPVYAADTARYEQHFIQYDNVLGWRVHSACVVPIGEEGKSWLGALALLCKDDRLTVEDFELGVELSALIGKLLERVGGVDAAMSPLIRVERMEKTVLEADRHTYSEILCEFDAQKKAFLRMFREGLLAEDEALTFDGWEMSAHDEKMLKNWRKRGVAVVSRGDAPVKLPRVRRDRIAKDGVPHEIAADLMGLWGVGYEELKNKANAWLLMGGDECESVRARVALCLMRRPQLIVCDLSECSRETVLEMRAYLKLLCYEKLVTVIVFPPRA